MSAEAPPRLADLTTERLAALLASPGPLVALLPVGSTEPHGPHLPLATDQIISEGVADRAARALGAHGVLALVAPGVPYGVTDFARGFAGAVSVAAPALSGFLRAVTEALLAEGFAHVCLINNHLEPAQDAAVREAARGLGARASVACPLTRRWARTLGDEFRSGACHAGRYETSLVAALRPAGVDQPTASALPDVDISLSEGIRSHRTSFRAMGIDRAYTGSPRRATAAEGERTLDLLAAMVVAEVLGSLASLASPPALDPG